MINRHFWRILSFTALYFVVFHRASRARCEAAPSIVSSWSTQSMFRIRCACLISKSEVISPRFAEIKRWVSNTTTRELSRTTLSASQRLKVLPYPYLRPCLNMASIIDGKGIAKWVTNIQKRSFISSFTHSSTESLESRSFQARLNNKGLPFACLCVWLI